LWPRWAGIRTGRAVCQPRLVALGRATNPVSEFTRRTAVAEDYDTIAAVVDEWWGRPILTALPRLFLDHFHRTSFVVEDEAGLGAFLVGFLSPSQPEHAYIHFVGVRPDLRSAGLARRMYEDFFDVARADGRITVAAITSPVNERSVAFHRHMGFAVRGPVDGYHGAGTALIVFSRAL
jgi:predicted GNAT superfamily acetyltransferase